MLKKFPTYDWASFLISSIAILGFARWRLLYRSIGVEASALNLFYVMGQDILVVALLGLVLCVLFKKRKWLFISSLGVLYSAVGIMFQVKMGEPLTAGLLAQVGGVFEMTASIQSPGFARSYVLIGLLIVAYYALWFAMLRLAGSRQKIINYASVFVLIIGLCSSVTTPPDLEILAINPVIALVRKPPGPESLLLNPVFAGITPRKLHREAVITAGGASHDRKVATGNQREKHNVVVLLMETFSNSLIEKDSDFERIMPSLYARRKQFLSYKRHFSPWPLSSKAAYAFICSDYTYPSNVIEMRLFPNAKCESWVQVLKNSGYATWTGFSGLNTFDNIGKFFQAQGFALAQDRRDFVKNGKYAEISWGLDDQVLVDGFEKWLNTLSSDPFAALFVPINSHHPYWTPDKAFEKFTDPYQNSFHYQDQIIERVFQLLEKKDLLKNTIVIVTGDHGRRFSAPQTPGTLLEDSFHVPLFIYSPEAAANTDLSQPRVFDFPTSHLEVGGWILEQLKLGGAPLAGHTLKPGKPVFLFYDMGDPLYMLIDNERSWLLNAKQGRIFKGGRWVNDLKDECNGSECMEAKQWFMDIISHSVLNFKKLAGG